MPVFAFFTVQIFFNLLMVVNLGQQALAHVTRSHAYGIHLLHNLNGLAQLLDSKVGFGSRHAHKVVRRAVYRLGICLAVRVVFRRGLLSRLEGANLLGFLMG